MAKGNTSSSNGKSQFKGVVWNVRLQRWRVCVHLNGIANYCGSFKKKDERKAAIAYDTKAIQLGITTGLNILKPKK